MEHPWTTEKVLTTEEYEAGAEKLALAIQSCQERTGKKFKYIWGIPYGGVTIAKWLADRLDLRLILQMALPIEHKDELVVAEDIVDTGNTLARLKIKELGIPVFALFKTTWATIEPDGYAFTKDSRGCFVRFPWWEVKGKAGYNATV